MQENSGRQVRSEIKGGQLGERVAKKVGEKTGEKVGESFGEIDKLNHCLRKANTKLSMLFRGANTETY